MITLARCLSRRKVLGSTLVIFHYWTTNYNSHTWTEPYCVHFWILSVRSLPPIPLKERVKVVRIKVTWATSDGGKTWTRFPSTTHVLFVSFPSCFPLKHSHPLQSCLTHFFHRVFILPNLIYPHISNPFGYFLLSKLGIYSFSCHPSCRVSYLSPLLGLPQVFPICWDGDLQCSIQAGHPRLITRDSGMKRRGE